MIMVALVINSIIIIVVTFDTKVTEIFVLGVGFFLQTSFDFLTSHVDEFFNILQKFLLFWDWTWKVISPVITLVTLCGFKDCHFGQFGTFNVRYISRI